LSGTYVHLQSFAETAASGFENQVSRSRFSPLNESQ
jgi:hypothetical protein